MKTTILALPLVCSVCGGHCKSNGFTVGYGFDITGARVCYACCADRDIARMIESGRHDGLYLEENPKYRAPTVGMCGSGGAPYYVTNWPSTLKFAVYGVRKSWHNFAGHNGRRDCWFNGPDGHVWHGVSIGDMDLIRCRRTKETWRKVGAA